MHFSLISLALLAVTTNAQFQSFLTRPDITGAVEFQIVQPAADPAALAPGYYFITPYVSDFSSSAYGPMIFDYTGQLIWYGNASVEVRALDMHVCDYNNHGVGDHLCWNDALPVAQGGHSQGVIRFFDNTYTQVGTDYGAANGLVGPDIHELNTPEFGDGTSMIQDVYQSTPADLTAYGGPVDGYVWSGCFQEVDLNSHDVLFQWCAFDHIGLNETYAYMTETPDQYHNAISGNGTQQGPWDYVHMNAIDRTPSGDYLISLRHAHAIIKVAGPQTQSAQPPGTVLWRLGGKLTNFTLDAFQFSWQHCVRSQLGSTTTDDLTLFDNSGDGSSQTAPASSGKWIHVDTATWQATLTHQYPMPEGVIATSQGSVQPLPNGNVLVGWGALPYFTEFDPNGTALFHTHFGLSGNDNLQNYRAWKYPWTGSPATDPVILPYALNCTGELYAYVSWNGATDVTTYRFHKTADPTGLSTTSTTSHPRTGFETMADLGGFAPYVFVEALDAGGNVLGTSATNATFVPSEDVAGGCGEMACGEGFVYGAGSAQSCAGELDLALVFDIPRGIAPAWEVGKTFEGVLEE